MTAGTGPDTDDAAVDWRRVTHGVLLGLAGTLLAVAFKLRCGIVPDPVEAFRGLCYSDVPAIWTDARLDVGAVPYLDHALEYPPLTGLWVWLAAVVSVNTGQFVVRTAGLLLLAGGAIGGMLAHMVGVRRTLLFAASPTLIIAGAINWDLPSVAFAVAGLLAHRRGRDGWAGVWLGLGAAAKLWPALLVPPIVLAAWVGRGRDAGVRSLLGAAATWLALNVPVMLVAPDGWARFLELSRERGPTPSSLWRLVPDLTGSAPDIPVMNAWSGLLLLAGMIIVLAVALHRDRPSHWHLAALPLVACFLLTSKVYSPQFTLWILPLLALATPPIWVVVALLGTDLAVHMTVFPYIGGELGLTEATSAAPVNMAVTARALLLAVAAWWGWRRSASAPLRPQPTLTRP